LAPLTDAPGLTEAEARRRLEAYGPNVIPPRGRHAVAVEYLLHFRNPLVLLLIAASVVLGFTGDTTSMTIIVGIVLASVTLDFLQEHRAERALARLQSTVAATAVVVRDAASRVVPVAALVPGDAVLITAGDIVPADGRLVSADRLFVDEAALTGESYPVEKRVVGQSGQESGALRMGTSIASGTGCFVVDVTGASTSLGSMAAELAARRPEPPLERGARQFGLMILRLTLFLALFVLLVNAAFHRAWLDSFLFAVALAVGLTPELLPMIVSVTLARGALRLAKHHVIVKRASAIYALGGIDILCTDKTGTLTEATIRVAGSDDGYGRPSERALALAVLNSRLVTGLRSPLDEAVLLHVPGASPMPRKLDELPFDFVRRLASVLVRGPGDPPTLIVKGAPEDVLARCTQYIVGANEDVRPLDDVHRAALLARFEAVGEQGLRVLAVATRTLPGERTHVAPEDESGLAFAGYVTFFDPPRPDAARALGALARTGITVKILTGDNERVARHVCATLALPVAGTLLGREIDALSDDALAGAAASATLLCRLSPAQKTRVIGALRARGHVVGFMGDGINDAPAMHAADVGISVQGAAGVAREAADVILTRGRLGVVRDGVIEGRRTYANIMKYLMMVTSSNFGNMLSMAAATLFLPFLPMLPVQILLNNLLYDVSETAIPFDRVDDAELRRPHRWDIHEIQRFMLVLGPVSSVFDLLTFAVLLALNAAPALFQTGWFIESIATQVLVIFVVRTRSNPLRSRPHPLLAITSLTVVALAVALPFSPLASWLGFVPLPAPFLAMLVVLVGVYLMLAQACKHWVYRAHGRWSDSHSSRLIAPSLRQCAGSARAPH
jgi:Mg2+-importing ATPase